jgi:hypothetical protein
VEDEFKADMRRHIPCERRMRTKGKNTGWQNRDRKQNKQAQP